MFRRESAQTWIIGIVMLSTTASCSNTDPGGVTTTPDPAGAGTAGSVSSPACKGGFKGGSGGSSGSRLTQPTTMAAKTPPPISGGTLLATHDGKLLVASDPDRDLVYFIDAANESLLFTRPLNAGDEPGRIVEDAAGRVHIALRGAGEVASMTREANGPITRRTICDLPRGIAYDAAQDALQVACAEGTLVTLAAAPSGTVTRRLELGADLRDVVVRGSELFVSRFRSAELLSVDANGEVVDRNLPLTFQQQEQVLPEGENACTSKGTLEMIPSSPTLAWRSLDVPGYGVAMLHQRARQGDVQTTSGGYGGGMGCAPGIVHTSVTLNADSKTPRSADIPGLALAVDLAASPDGGMLAAVAPGNWSSGRPQVELYRLADSDTWVGTSPVTVGAGAAAGGSTAVQDGRSTCTSTAIVTDTSGQATAVAFTSPEVLAVQEREPAGIAFINVGDGQLRSHVDLKQASRYDTGHALFHMRAGAGLACASCHGEGGDDSHVWTFHGIGARRTQQLRGGILGTEPFHWNGDMQDFPTLVQEVFVGRMQGPGLAPDQTTALATWIDRQPAYQVSSGDPAAAARGQALFESAAVGCTSCHTGTHLTNNQAADVGTGVTVQVPSLHDVALRSPLMHDGCAKTLLDRFTVSSCGGGDQHGHTSQLTDSELSDLVAYVTTL